MKVSLVDYTEELNKDEENLTGVLVDMMATGMKKKVAMYLLAEDLGITVGRLEQILRLIKRRKAKLKQQGIKKAKIRAKKKVAKMSRKRNRRVK